MKDLVNYSLLPHNTFGIDAKCRRFVEFASVSEAVQVASLLRQDINSPFMVVGGGSNLLLTADYDGTVVHSAIRGIEQSPAPSDADGDTVLVRCGSGEVWDDVVAHCVAQGWHGAENLSLIPGEVGASAVQNIGAYGVEAKDIIHRVEAVEIATGRCRTFRAPIAAMATVRAVSRTNGATVTSLRTSLTGSALRSCHALTTATFVRNCCAEAFQNPLPKMRQTIIDIRNAKLPDPAVEGNAGSFFMNPIVSREKFNQLQAHYPQMPHYYIDEQHEKIPAGWMIDQCGWKGRTLGKAGVHDKQALVLVNRGGAAGSDIVALCEAIRSDVLARFGIDIHPEVNIV